MATIMASNAADLRDIAGLSGRILSVYFRLPDPDEDTTGRRHAVVARLAEHGADAARLRLVDDALCDLVPGRGAAALFVGEDGLRLLVRMPGAEIEDSALGAEAPDLVPLLAWHEANPARVLAALDRSGADITVFPDSGGESALFSVEGPDDELSGNAPSGMSQDRFQHRVEDSRQHNAAREAEAVADALTTSGARLLLLAADDHTAKLLADRLPAWVRREATIHRLPGGRGHEGSVEHRHELIAAATAEYATKRATELLTSLDAQSGPGGMAVQGAAAVLRALARGRVRTLIVAAPHDRPGQGSPDERVAWFGDGPTTVSAHRTDVEHLGERPRHGRLVDVAIRAALLTDAEVRIVPADLPGTPVQGIGALCRFA